MNMMSNNYNDFTNINVESINGIKKITWHPIYKSEKILDNNIMLVFGMPFNAFIIHRNNVSQWEQYCKSHQSEVSNAVYILYGKEYIYAGKAANGDRLIDHVNDCKKNGFEYQIVFVPNKETNLDARNKWDDPFKDTLESKMIDIVKQSVYCGNSIDGKSIEKCMKNMGGNTDKMRFADDVVKFIFDAFNDLTYHTYLISTVSSNNDNDNISSIVSDNEDKDDENTDISLTDNPRFNKRMKFWKALESAMYKDESCNWRFDKLTSYSDRIPNCLGCGIKFNEKNIWAVVVFNKDQICVNIETNVKDNTMNIVDNYIINNNITGYTKAEVTDNSWCRWRICIDYIKNDDADAAAKIPDVVEAMRKIVNDFKNL